MSCYLDIEGLLSIAKKHKVDAIHPGYGFLSENAQLSRRCQEVLHVDLVWMISSAPALHGSTSAAMCCTKCHTTRQHVSPQLPMTNPDCSDHGHADHSANARRKASALLGPHQRSLRCDAHQNHTVPGICWSAAESSSPSHVWQRLHFTCQVRLQLQTLSVYTCKCGILVNVSLSHCRRWATRWRRARLPSPSMCQWCLAPTSPWKTWRQPRRLQPRQATQ